MAADPTLKDVVKALAEMRRDFTDMRRENETRFDELKGDIEAHRAETEAHRAETEAHRAETEAHRAETEAHRAETKKGFADLDAELTKHAAVHGELEKDVASLKRRPPRTAARPSRSRPPTR